MTNIIRNLFINKSEKKLHMALKSFPLGSYCVKMECYMELVTFYESGFLPAFCFHCWLFASFTSQIIHNRWVLCIAFIFILGSMLIYPTLLSIIEFNNPPPKVFTCLKSLYIRVLWWEHMFYSNTMHSLRQCMEFRFFF